MKVVIRKAILADAAQIAKVHIQSWKETYPGIMSERILGSLKVENSQKHWEHLLQNECCFYVAVVDDNLCGFVTGGPNHPCEGCDTGLANQCGSELGAMYILASYHGQGIGKALFAAFTAELSSLGYISMVAWVAEQNPACGFYAKMGGKLVDKRIMNVCGEDIPVVAYSYCIYSMLGINSSQ